MAIITGGTTGGGGTGTVTTVTSANNSIVVATPTTTPALTVGSVDKLHTNNPPAAACAMNGQKLTGLAAGTVAGDSLRFEQVLAANVIPVADLVAGTAGQVLGGTGPSYALPPGFEINYTQITSSVNIVSTTEATGTTILSPGAITFDGTAVLVQVFAPLIATDTAAAGDRVVVSLFEGATQIARLGQISVPSVTSQASWPFNAMFRFTPTAASHTYTVTAFATSTTGTPAFQAQGGGTNNFSPGFIRFTKV